MELRHLRYFVAVAECRSFKVAAETRLHTTQPSLSRQIADLEREVDATLLVRNPRGVELTAAGQVFLDHARLLLTQAQMAVRAARRAVDSAKPSFTMGFMIGHETTWLPAVVSSMRDEIPNIHIIISTQNSPQLGDALVRGLIDAAIMRRDDGSSELAYVPLVDEMLQVYLPSDHPLAKHPAIRAQDMSSEVFLSVSGLALSTSGLQPALRRAIDRYFKTVGVDIRPSHEVDNLAGIMSLIRSTGGLALLPSYAKSFLPEGIAIRPLEGPVPKIDLSIAFRPANTSPILKQLLSRTSDIIARASG